MNDYHHQVQYYETDRMGITHHSNYIRWMEEARVDFLAQIGWPYDRMEAEGIISPVRSVQCKYVQSTTFGDNVRISVRVAAYNGVVLTVGYQMYLVDKLVCTASSEHCFLGQNGMPLRLRRDYPAFDAAMKALAEEE